jgi:hypothetical protein
MSISLFSPARTVLMISDEFLSIYKTGARGVTLVESVPWSTENFESAVARIIVRECGRKPVLILNDMVEQHYRKERVVRLGVNVMDRSSMLKRKLGVAFPNYPVRSAYMLKEKSPKTEKQGAADIYIFAAIANSDQLAKAVTAARQSMADVSGLCLLPVESSDMVRALSTRLARKGKGKPVWSVFIGQHRNGSLRQVVTKNGDLALTRMSPVSDRDDAPDVWAAEVYQEFKATMSYLTRFGYDQADGLDLIVVANPGAGDILSGMVEENCTVHVLTAGEAANLLGLAAGRQENGRYADMLHIAWASRKSRFILPMQSPQIEELSRPRQAAMLAGLVLAAGACFLGYQGFDTATHLAQGAADLAQENANKAQLDVKYQSEVQRLNALGFDVQLVQSAIAVNTQFEDARIKILNLVEASGKALGKDMRIDSLEVERVKTGPVEQVVNAATATPTPIYEARLKMTYPSTADIDKGNKEVAELRNRLEQALPGHTVKVTKFLKDYEYTEGLVVEAGDLKKENVQQDFVAEILVQGMPPAAPPAEGGVQ